MAAQFPDTSLDTLEAVTARHRQIDAWNSTPVMEGGAGAAGDGDDRGR